jgi:hypothetical protein
MRDTFDEEYFPPGLDASNIADVQQTRRQKTANCVESGTYLEGK